MKKNGFGDGSDVKGRYMKLLIGSVLEVDHVLVGCIFVKVEQLCEWFVSSTIVLPSNLGRGKVGN